MSRSRFRILYIHLPLDQALELRESHTITILMVDFLWKYLVPPVVPFKSFGLFLLCFDSPLVVLSHHTWVCFDALVKLFLCDLSCGCVHLLEACQDDMDENYGRLTMIRYLTELGQGGGRIRRRQMRGK